ncbi:MAG: hypothetical protein GF388_06680, partial [Candidatus Aegiribacteria sp.]|nr:hypothetical protein [Candidatus Aegiribacteria sp.]
GTVWLSSSVDFGNTKTVLLKNPSQLELNEWLETVNGSKPCVLSDGRGKVYAVTEKTAFLFSENAVHSLSDLLDQVSMTAFLSAGAKCLSGEAVRDFSVLTRKDSNNRRSQVISLTRSGLMKSLLTVSFSSPSMAMRVFEQDNSRFMRVLFSTVPVPAMMVGSGGDIHTMNKHGANLFLTDGDDPSSMLNYYDKLSEKDRERVAAIHRNRSRDAMSTVHYRADFITAGETAEQFQVSCVPAADGDDLMIMLFPAQGIDGSRTASIASQTINEMVDILRKDAGRESHARTVLEFLRTGLDGKGAAYISKERRITVGEIVLPAGRTEPVNRSGPYWTETDSGYDVTIPLRSKRENAYVRISGIPAREKDAIGSLVLGIAPVLAEYIQTRIQLENMSGFLNALNSYMETIQGREKNVQVILDRAGPVTGADYLVVHTVSSKEPILKQLVTSGTASDPGPLRIETPSIASWAYTHMEICYVPDTAIDQRFSPIFPSSRSEFSIPLVSGGKAMGTLTIGSVRRDAFGYPAGGFLQLLGIALSLWLFKDSHRLKGEGPVSRKSTRDNREGMEDLLMSISYHMKAPISSLMANIDVLSSEASGELNEDQRNTLESINTSLTDLTEYSERMLNFMKIELSRDEPESAWESPILVIADLVPMLREKARSRNLELETELPADEFNAYIDRSRLEQILINLVNNAIQYNKAGGTVKIVAGMEGSEHWQLEVFNTGRGIPPEDLPNVFDRFYSGRSDEDTTRLGIGLTIVKS